MSKLEEQRAMVAKVKAHGAKVVETTVETTTETTTTETTTEAPAQ